MVANLSHRQMRLTLLSETGAYELVHALAQRDISVEHRALRDFALQSGATAQFNDIVLLDCGANVRRGLSVLRELKDRAPTVPVIFITEKSSEETAIQAFRLGARDYHRKPVDVFQLKETLRNLRIAKETSREQRTPITCGGSALTCLLDPGNGTIPDNLVRTIFHMEDNFARDLRLDGLASQAGMSKHHFCRVFKKFAGIPPMQFLVVLRVERAKSLLRHSSLTVSTIAAETGFNDISSFNRQFKTICGVTPTEFKKDDRGKAFSP